MNCPEFQGDFFSLEKAEQLALIRVLKKTRQLTWSQLYSDPGLKWEVIHSKQSALGDRIYSFRFSQKYRAVALREGIFLRLMSLHADHDSAYKT
jgi:hypothetical protein